MTRLVPIASASFGELLRQPYYVAVQRGRVRVAAGQFHYGLRTTDRISNPFRGPTRRAMPIHWKTSACPPLAELQQRVLEQIQLGGHGFTPELREALGIDVPPATGAEIEGSQSAR